jgi:hypothetical protein
MTRAREGTSSKSIPTRSVVRDICFPCAPCSTISMRVCRVAVPASADENVPYDARPVLRHPNKAGKLTIGSTGTEMASFSSRSHSIRVSRPCGSSVMPINRTLRKCMPCISTISSIRSVEKDCRSDRRSASDVRWVKRVRDSKERINDLGTVVLPASGDPLQTTSSTAKCLSAFNEVRGKLQAKSCHKGQMMNKVLG